MSSFEEKLTAQEIITALGGTGRFPGPCCGRAMDWTAKFLQREGRCIAGGDHRCARGRPPAARPLPGRLPRSVVYQEAATQAVNGIPVTTASFRGQSDGRTLTTCAADFLAGGTGVSFEYLSPMPDSPPG